MKPRVFLKQKFNAANILDRSMQSYIKQAYLQSVKYSTKNSRPREWNEEHLRFSIRLVFHFVPISWPVIQCIPRYPSYAFRLVFSVSLCYAWLSSYL